MSADHSPRQVLFVDDEPSTHRLVQQALQGEDLRLTCVSDGARALHELERGRIELLVTSLMLPVVDGVDLLRHLANRNVAISVIVTTDREPPPTLPRSPMRFLREPLQPATLTAQVREWLALPPPGSAIAVAELAQVLAVTRRSCTLRAQVNGVHGELSFQAGVLVDASVGAIHGEAAARALLAWRRAQLRIEPMARRQATIQSELAALLPVLAESVGLAVDERLVAAAQVSTPLHERRSNAPELQATPVNATRPPALYIVPAEPGPPETDDVPDWERPAGQAALAALLAEALKIEGAIGAGLGVWELGQCIGVQTCEPALPAATMRAAMSGDSRMLRATMTTMRRLGREAEVTDLLIMLDSQIHVLVPLPQQEGLYFALVLDRKRSNLAFARMRAGALVHGFRREPSDAPTSG